MAKSFHDLSELSKKVSAAISAGQLASEAQADDGGSANLDHVVLTGLRGVREDSLSRAGISAHKGRFAGEFHLTAPFNGQGNRRYAGVQAMHAALQAEGVDCFVFYQLD